MGFFDQLGKKASDTMQSAKEKTNKISTEMKLKSQFSEKKDRITVLYSEIGKEAYSNYVKGINEITESLNEKLKEINDINEELRGINKELLSLKGIKVCPNCGGQIAVGADFCPKCGKKTSEMIETEIENEEKTVEVEENKAE